MEREEKERKAISGPAQNQQRRKRNQFGRAAVDSIVIGVCKQRPKLRLRPADWSARELSTRPLRSSLLGAPSRRRRPRPLHYCAALESFAPFHQHSLKVALRTQIIRVDRPAGRPVREHSYSVLSYAEGFVLISLIANVNLCDCR